MRPVLLVMFSVWFWTGVGLGQPALSRSATNVARTQLPTNLPAPAVRLATPPGHSHVMPAVTNRLRAVPQRHPPAELQPASHLAWDANTKTVTVTEGMTNVHLAFWLTNVSTEEVLVHAVRTSCGCAVAQLPAYPWRVAPGGSGPIKVDVNLHGKMGSFAKSVAVETSAGTKALIVHINMPGSAPNPMAGMDVERLKNMRMAMADRQVVFKGECAKCHSEPATGKYGEQLYAAACGVCHDSAQRAALVPDLKKLPHPTSPEHWRKWIAEGKTGSMMPAFAKSAGGPLSAEQIESLVEFLADTITRTAAQATASSTNLKAQ